MFNSLISRAEIVVPFSSENAATDNTNSSAMKVDSGLKLPEYTDTEIMMGDTGLSLIEFMRRFEKFKMDEISINEVEDDICLNAKDCFDESLSVSLIGLRYTEDENTIE